MVEAMETLFPDKRDVIGKVKAIPLSRKTATGRIESINDHLRMTLLTHIDQADYFSIAIDESTDIMDVAQLAVFVRFFDGEEMKEILTLVGLEGETTSQATYDALVKRLDKMKIPLHKFVSVTTDGAPAMVGRDQGLIAELKKDMPSMLAFHCIIHQTVLCGKLNDHFQHLMCKAMKMINFLRSQSALRHRNLRKFLKESDAICEDLLTYNNIRRLSKENALSRLWSIRQELTSFLNTCTSLSAKQFQEMMSSSKDMSNLAFLVDICSHLNDLNRVDPILALSQLNALRREEGTTLQEHAMEVERQVRIAYVDLLNRHRNSMAMETFCSSLRDPALQQHLLAVHTLTLLSVVRAGNDYLQIEGELPLLLKTGFAKRREATAVASTTGCAKAKQPRKHSRTTRDLVTADDWSQPAKTRPRKICAQERPVETRNYYQSLSEASLDIPPVPDTAYVPPCERQRRSPKQRRVTHKCPPPQTLRTTPNKPDGRRPALKVAGPTPSPP
ncbi:general transcription factor II-I repeat domain-containing protein 2-like [Watersipora subatra]|uniref:general transcription factor II-I repeat domain-containing protein 2-like n=1 Tax=Watersipora subatra TaxID=2589382 RepID=UPI00355BD581